MPKDKQDELFYWVDEEDQVLGSLTRREAHNGSMKIHRGVSIVLINSSSAVLLQERSQTKDMFPGYWTTAASGHVTYGQSYETTAAKEMQEEIGLEVPLTYQTKHLISDDHEREFDAVFVGKTDVLPTTIDPDEVASVKWCSREEVLQLLAQQRLTPPAIKALQAINYL